MKKILIVGLFLDKNTNIPTQASELSNVLRKNGYEVHTVSHVKNKFLRLFDTIFFIFRKRNNFDVGIVQVYTGLSFFWGYVSATMIKYFGKKLILTIRGGALPERMKKRPKNYLKLLHKADVITCPSAFMAKTLEEYGIDTVRIENVIQLQDYQFFEKKSLQPILFWMRALSPIYNPEMAVNVIEELKNTYNYKNIKLYMGGPDMGLRSKLLSMIKSRGLTDNIELVGFVNMKKKFYFANACDIYLCTNKIDNAPVSFLEMMAMGLPIISTNVGGIPHLVTHNETAILVPDNDHHEMAKEIDNLLTNPVIARKLITNGRKFIDRFSADNVYKKWHQLIEDL